MFNMNKYIVLFLITLICSVSFGQAVVNRSGAGNTPQDINLQIGSSFRVPVFADTTTANLAHTLDSVGKLLYTHDVEGLWYRTCCPKHWIQLTGSTFGCQGLTSGGIVSWDSLFIFDVTSGLGCVNGKSFSFAQGVVTLSNSDLTNPRFDIIGVDTLGALFHITGTPAPTPVVPISQVDFQSQLILAIVRIDAGSSSAEGQVSQLIYDENVGQPTEWVTSGTGSPLPDPNNTQNPYHLAKAIKCANFSQLFNYSDIHTTPTPVNIQSTYNVLKQFIYINSAFGVKSNLSVTLYSGSQPVTLPLDLSNAQGFNKGVIKSYQNVSIPLSDFTYFDSFMGVIDGIRYTPSGANADSFYIDYIILTGGTGGISGSNHLVSVQLTPNTRTVTQTTAAGTTRFAFNIPEEIVLVHPPIIIRDIDDTTQDIKFQDSSLVNTGQMFFAPTKNGAFRAGIVNSTQWDYSNVGNASAGFGTNNIISGANSLGSGSGNTISGITAYGGGSSSAASGTRSFAHGLQDTASGTGSVSLGGTSNKSAGANSGIVGGTNNTNSLTNSSGSFIGGGSTNTNTVSNAATFGFNNWGQSRGCLTGGNVCDSTNTDQPTSPEDSISRVFQIGNGQGGGGGYRSNAITTLKGTQTSGGKTGFGVLIPTANVDIGNTFRFRSGAVANYVMTCDANGNGYWLPSSGGTGTVTNVSALTIGTTGTDLTSSVANPTTTPVITLNVPTASASNRGALSSTDWSTFNNKQATVTSGSATTKSGTAVNLGGTATGDIAIAMAAHDLDITNASDILLQGNDSIYLRGGGAVDTTASYAVYKPHTINTYSSFKKNASYINQSDAVFDVFLYNDPAAVNKYYNIERFHEGDWSISVQDTLTGAGGAILITSTDFGIGTGHSGQINTGASGNMTFTDNAINTNYFWKWDNTAYHASTGDTLLLAVLDDGTQITYPKPTTPTLSFPSIITLTSTQTDNDFNAVAGTAYALEGDVTGDRTITIPSLSEGDIFEFYNENTNLTKHWISSQVIYLSDGTTITELTNQTNYVIRYVGGKLRISN